MPAPLCVYFHYESSLKNVRIPDSGAAIYVDGTDEHEGSIFKGTGLPVNNGIMPKEAEELIGIILEDPKVICFEITELNPRFDVNHVTTNMVYHILEKALSVLKI
jgi:arginase